MTSPSDHLRAAADRLLAAGRAEGIEVDGPLGRWLEAQAQALLGLGDILQGQGEQIGEVLGRIEVAAAAELRNLQAAIEGATHVVRQGEFAVRQARQAQIGVVVEREHLAQKMLDETLPMFADKLQGALVIQAEGWNARARDKRFKITAAIVISIFLGGYGLSWWQDSGRLVTLSRCLAHPVEADGQLYCAVSGLFGDAKKLANANGG